MTRADFEIVKEAREHVVALIQERESRESKKHPDDARIATEVAAHMFKLGRVEKGLREDSEGMADAIKRNDSSIEEVRGIFALLQKELDIATHR